MFAKLWRFLFGKATVEDVTAKFQKTVDALEKVETTAIQTVDALNKSVDIIAMKKAEAERQIELAKQTSKRLKKILSID